MTISASAPPAIKALADMLSACASWVAYVGSGNESARQYISDVTVTSLTLPAITIASTSDRYVTIAPGVSLPSGNLAVSIYAIDDVNDLETLARAICKELAELQTGLPNITAETGECLKVSEAAIAGGSVAYSEIQLSIDYGLEG